MTIKDKDTGKELTFELLPNGILKAYDYGCGWDVSFKKVDGKWVGHMNGGLWGYRGILRNINLLQESLDNVLELNKDLQEIV